MGDSQRNSHIKAVKDEKITKMRKSTANVAKAATAAV
jgi:hypothetical protein